MSAIAQQRDKINKASAALQQRSSESPKPSAPVLPHTEEAFRSHDEIHAQAVRDAQVRAGHHSRPKAEVHVVGLSASGATTEATTSSTTTTVTSGTTTATTVTSAGQTVFRVGAAGLRGFHAVVVENPKVLKVPCMITGALLIIMSFLAMLNVLQAVLSPLVYMLLISQMFAGVAIIMIETPPEWSQFFGYRETLFKLFGFLALPVGRAFFYIYIAAFLFALHDDSEFIWYMIQLGMGGVLVLSGFAQLFAIFCRCGRTHDQMRDQDSEVGRNQV